LRTFDILCLTPHLWGDRVRRLQHLMRVAARNHRVVIVEQAANLTEDTPLLSCPARNEDGVRVFRPADRYWSAASVRVRSSLRAILGSVEHENLVIWIDNPRMLPVVPVDSTVTLVCDLANPMATGAKLLSRADLLLTDGSGGFQASRHLHPRAYLFPHAADIEHFSTARRLHQDPPDQSGIAYPRVGFWGTVNDRIDFGLLEAVAARLPRVQFMMVGAVERAGRERMTSRANVHWLGARPYADLPAYIAGWDAAMLPFARNDSTRFLSPPQIPEYLAAGRPVVSTGLPDVLHPYGASGLVRVADTAEEFAAAIDGACRGRSAEWLATVDRYLKALSWQSSWAGIEHLINAVIAERKTPVPVERRARRVESRVPMTVMH